MEKTFWRQFDSYLLLGLFVLALISAYQIISRQYSLPFNVTSSGEPVAELKNLSRDVRKKNANALSWRDAQVGMPLYHFDQVFTHQNSSGIIRFHQGPEFQISENTLFRIEKRQDEFNLNLERGSVLASFNEKNSEMVFAINGQAYTLRSQKAEVQIVKGEQGASVSVVSGEASLESAGEKVDLKENSQASIQNNQNLNVQSFETQLKSPQTGETFHVAEKKDVSFQWETEAKEYKWQLSSAPDFQSLIDTEKLGQKSSGIRRSLSPGFYYWRLVGMEEGKMVKVITPVKWFQVIEEKPLNWTRPERSHLYRKTSNPASEVFDFSWKGVGGNYTFFVQERREGDWKPLRREELEQNHYRLSLADHGMYRVRVKISDSDRPEAVWSEPLFISLESLSFPAPKTSLPKDKSEVVTFQKTSRVRFTWSSVPGAEKYLLRLKGPEGVQETVVDSAFATLELNKPGNYIWSVRVFDPRDREGEGFSFADEKSFELKKNRFDSKSPENGVAVELSRPNQEVHFEWTQSMGAKKYTFEVAKDPHFENTVLKRTLHSNRTQTQIPEVGVYYWRAQIMTDEGKEVFSSPAKVIIRPTPPPKRPEIKDKVKVKIEYLESFQRDEQTFNPFETLLNFFFPAAKAQNQKPGVAKIQWEEPEQDVEFFLVQIFSSAEASKPLKEVKVSENQYVWENPRPGTYYWRLAYIDYWGRQGPFSELSQLEVVGEAKKKQETTPELEEIDLLAPWHGREVPLGETLRFQWKFIGSAKAIQGLWLEFSSDLDFSNPLKSFSLKKGQTQKRVNLSFLGKGNDQVYWRLRAQLENQVLTSLRRRVEFRKPKQKKTEEKSLAKKRDKPESSQREWGLKVGLKTTLISYELKGDKEKISVDGQSFVGSHIQYEKILREGKGFFQNSRVRLVGNFASGSVFEDLDFVSHELQGQYLYPALNQWYLSTSAYYHRHSSYQLSSGGTSQSDLSGSTKGFFGGDLGLEFHGSFVDLPVIIGFDYLAGGVSGPQVDFGLLFSRHYGLDVTYQRLEFEEGEGLVEQSGVSLIFSYLF